MVLKGTGKPIIAGVTAAVVLLIIILSVFLWIRKKRASNQSSEAEERPDDRERPEQDNTLYASLDLSNNQEDSLYSDLRSDQLHRHMEEQEVPEYAAVNFNRAGNAPRKKKTSNQSSEAEERPDDRERQEVQDNPLYASLDLSNNQADHLYSDLRSTQLHRHMEEQEVPEYAAVNFNRAEPEVSKPGKIQLHCTAQSTKYEHISNLTFLDSRLEYENVSDLQVVTAAQTEDTEEQEDLDVADSGFITEDGWGVTYTSTHICALKGSTVDINCTYRYPSRINNVTTVVDETLWFTKESINEHVDLRTDSEYAGRVQYRCDKNDCTLRITDLRERDSAEYKFRFITNQPGGKYSGSPGVTLNVTDLQVKVIQSTTSSPSKELKCNSSCLPDRSSFIWYKNLPSTSASPSGEIIEGSSVNLTCSSVANPAAKYTWYKENVNPDLQPLSKEPQLVFSSIQSSDSGEYYCTAENQLEKRTSEYIFIDVKYGPKLPSTSASPSGEIIEGSSVTLNCSSDANPAAKYTWYKKNQPLFPAQEGNYKFTSISSDDKGMYYCKSENQYGWINSSSLFIDVLYAPKLPSMSVSPSGEIVEDSSVNLTCSSDANPAANYTWYKKNVNPDLQPLGKEPQLVFSSIQSSDSGEYYCTAENQLGKRTSEYIFIDVKYAPKLPSVSVSPSAEIVEGSSVTLTCSSDANPAANYTWYKENEDSLKASGQIFTITDVRPEHSGNYSCEAQNRRGSYNSTLHLMVVKGTGKLIIAGVTTAVLLLIIILSVFLWTRKKKASNQPSEAEERPDDRDREVQDNPLYDSVDFSNNQAEPLYSDIRSDQLRRHMEEQEVIEYAAVNFNRAEPEVSKLGKIQLHYLQVQVIQSTTSSPSKELKCNSSCLPDRSSFIWKKKTSNQSSEAEEKPDDRERQVQDNPLYASLDLSNNQADHIYSDLRSTQLHRHMEEQEVPEYAAVNFNRAGNAPRTRGQQTWEDPAALYSTVNKI
ncbi:B-cell receptor CD22-like [Scomber japonicus]|uniref:B-cell receptor CD22-like n=1 Tax=Scomber japonicus TaxID=13676 RepID=UPI002306807B|nr:B-cell receptor CD22-like [Scomber japonicus]